VAPRIIDRDTYDALLLAFREDPDNVNAAAKAAGCSWGMAKRALLQGWQERFEWARPIRDHLADEQKAARADRMLIVADRVAKDEQVFERAAAVDAARIRALEGVGVTAAMQAGSTLAESFAEIAEATRPIIVKVVKYLREVGDDPDAEIEDPVGVIKLLGTLAHNVRLVNASLHEAQKMERLLLGEPGEIVGHVDMSDESAQDALDRAKRAAEYAERKLKVVGGDEE
jgi:hypothetical protein